MEFLKYRAYANAFHFARRHILLKMWSKAKFSDLVNVRTTSMGKPGLGNSASHLGIEVHRRHLFDELLQRIMRV